MAACVDARRNIVINPALLRSAWKERFGCVPVGSDSQWRNAFVDYAPIAGAAYC